MCGSVQARQIVLDIPDEDIAIVESIVVDAEKWIQNAWAGKLEKCKQRVIDREVKLSIKENKEIPAGKDLIIDEYLKRPDALRKDRNVR